MIFSCRLVASTVEFAVLSCCIVLLCTAISGLETCCALSFLCISSTGVLWWLSSNITLWCPLCSLDLLMLSYNTNVIMVTLYYIVWLLYRSLIPLLETLPTIQQESSLIRRSPHHRRLKSSTKQSNYIAYLNVKHLNWNVSVWGYHGLIGVLEKTSTERSWLGSLISKYQCTSMVML